ncbi:hypothetical protein AUJ46_05550 [Candidatus Peregrinibacteria bacterium CG1_02_54_53]|nr:MAG: hypothetical protein AUJ46_05550 [Candidatus Peregrinibacteria bacterium CG1_02_54_53]
MSTFDEFDLESEVLAIVQDAIGVTIGVDPDAVQPAMALDELDEQQFAEALMEVEDQCERLPPLDNHPTHFHLTDTMIEKAKTVGDLCVATTDAIRALMK